MLAQLPESAIDEVASFRLSPAEDNGDFLAAHSLQIESDSSAAILRNPRQRGFDLLQNLVALRHPVRRILGRRFQTQPGLNIVLDQAQLFFAPGFDPAYCVDRCGSCDPVDVRRKVADFPLTLDRAPQSETRILLDVTEL